MDELYQNASLEEITLLEDANRRLNAQYAAVFGLGIAPYIPIPFAKTADVKAAHKQLAKAIEAESTAGLTKNYHVDGYVYKTV
jgi:hypothetical protein